MQDVLRILNLFVVEVVMYCVSFGYKFYQKAWDRKVSCYFLVKIKVEGQQMFLVLL